MKTNKIAMKIRWGDVDSAGVAYYPNYFFWFSVAADEFFKSIGISLKDLLNQKLGFPTGEAHCRFISPALYDDDIEIHTSVKDVKKKAIVLEHRVYKDRVQIADGFEVRVCVRLMSEGRMESVGIPEDVLRQIESNK